MGDGPMTADSIEAAFGAWRRTLRVVDYPTDQEIFGQGYVAGWNAKEETGDAALKARIEELEGALRDLVNETKNPGDGGEFEDGEWPALDRARAAISSADRG